MFQEVLADLKMFNYASVLRLFENFDRQFYHFLVEQDRQFQNTPNFRSDSFRFLDIYSPMPYILARLSSDFGSLVNILAIFGTPHFRRTDYLEEDLVLLRIFLH